jgi:polar amino acid transport system substrate-binding protein
VHAALLAAVAATLIRVAHPSSAAQVPPMAGAGGSRLRVMVDEDPPFVVKDGDRWSGWAIELWTEIAREAGLDWDVVGDGEPADIANDLAAGRADIGLGAIRVTKENAVRIDFSHPFFQASARILVLKAPGGEVAAALRSVATPAHARVLLAVLGLVAGMSALIYVLARRHDAANFPATRSEGLAEAVYITVSALLQGKLERKLLPGSAGSVLSTVWLVFGTGVVAYVTAALAAALAVQHLSSRLQDVADLVGKPVAAVKGHQTVPWLARRGINALQEQDIERAVDSLLAGRVNAVVHDEPVLAWWIVNHPAAPVLLVGQPFDAKDYAVALRHDSPLRVRVNVALLSLQEAGLFSELDRRWFGTAGR